MAIFLNTDDSRICLVKSADQYGLVLKSKKKGSTRDEEASLRHTPQLAAEPIEGFVAKVGQRTEYFEKPLTLVDFSKFMPIEPGEVTCPAGTYTLDSITVIVGSRTADLLVLEGTTVGLMRFGLETIMRVHGYAKEQEAKRSKTREVVSEHFGFAPGEIDDNFRLPCVNGLGTRIGAGPYHSLAVLPNQKPALIRTGMSIKEIADQL